MNNPLEEEVSAIIREVGNQLFTAYLEKFSQIFNEHGLGDERQSIPLEALRGIAEAFANASGYRIVLQAEVVEPIKGEADTIRIVGHRDVASAAPLWSRSL